MPTTSNIGGQTYFGPVHASKPPPKDHIYNEKTQRWVKRTGTIGREIAREQRRAAEKSRRRKLDARHAKARAEDFQRNEVKRKAKLQAEAEARKKKAAKLEKRRLEIAISKKKRAEDEARQKKADEERAKAEQMKIWIEEAAEYERQAYLADPELKRQHDEEESAKKQKRLDEQKKKDDAQKKKDDLRKKEIEQLEKAQRAATKRVNDEITQQQYESEVEEINNQDIELAEESIQQIEESIETLEHEAETAEMLEETIWKEDILKPVMNVVRNNVVTEPALNLREVAAATAVVGMIAAESSISSAIINTVATAIKAGGGNVPNVPALNEIAQGAYGGLPEVNQWLPAIAIAIKQINLGVAARLGGVAAIGALILALWHGINWSQATEKVQEDIKEVGRKGQEAINEFEMRTGLNYEEQVEIEWKDTEDEQHDEYLDERRIIDHEIAVEEGRALPPVLENATQNQQHQETGSGEVLPDITEETEEELVQEEKPSEPEKQVATGDEGEEEKRVAKPKKKTILPEYIAPALLLAAGIDAINRMFKQLLVPLAVVAFFRNELIKAVVGVVGREAVKKQRNNKKC